MEMEGKVSKESRVKNEMRCGIVHAPLGASWRSTR